MNIFRFVFILSFFVSFSAHAQTYFGISLGKSDDLFLESESTLELYGGVRLTPNFAIELSHIDLGEYRDQNEIVESISGFQYSLVGFMPLSEDVDLYAKVGRLNWESELIEDGISNTVEDDNMTYSLGASFDVAEGFQANIEYRTIEIESEREPNILSLGFSFSF